MNFNGRHLELCSMLLLSLLTCLVKSNRFTKQVFSFFSQTFNFDVEKLDWNTYFVRFVLGIKQFLLKEDLANLPVAQSRIRRLVVVYGVF